jgi:uncharacterized protein
VSRARDPRGSSQADAELELFGELERVYAEAEQLYAGWSCEASTDCCHFERTGREPYVTSLELSYLMRAVRKSGRAIGVQPAPRRLPVLASTEGRCPLLDAAGRCGAYGARPIGCRTFWCERTTETQPVRHRDMNELVRRIQKLAAQHVDGGERGRPLRRAIELCPGGRLPPRW